MKHELKLIVSGWGPFPIPGEKRRLQRAIDRANETMEIIKQLSDEELYPELEEDNE